MIHLGFISKKFTSKPYKNDRNWLYNTVYLYIIYLYIYIYIIYIYISSFSPFLQGFKDVVYWTVLQKQKIIAREMIRFDYFLDVWKRVMKPPGWIFFYAEKTGMSNAIETTCVVPHHATRRLCVICFSRLIGATWDSSILKILLIKSRRNPTPTGIFFW